MNHRAALKAMLQGEYPEEVCQFEWGYWPETIARWKIEGMPSDKDPWEAAGITRYDRVPVNVRFCPPFESRVLSETADTQIICDEEGVTKEVSKHGTAFPRFLHHPVETPADFAKIRPHLEASAPGRYPDDWPAAVARLAQRNHVLVMGRIEISFFGWHRDLMGLENLLIAYFEQPALIHAISEQHLAFLKAMYGRILKEVEFDFIFMWEDMSFKNGPLISPKLVREFMLPYYRDFISWAKGLRRIQGAGGFRRGRAPAHPALPGGGHGRDPSLRMLGGDGHPRDSAGMARSSSSRAGWTSANWARAERRLTANSKPSCRSCSSTAILAEPGPPRPARGPVARLPLLRAANAGDLAAGPAATVISPPKTGANME